MNGYEVDKTINTKKLSYTELEKRVQELEALRESEEKYRIVDRKSPPPIPGSRPRGNEHILFLDDEEALAFMSREMLQRLGYRVTALTDSRQALNLFKSQPQNFDMVITDMTMPHMTGAQLARKLMKIKPGIPVILCTGFSDMVDEKKTGEMGFREFVTKPILMKELAKTIRKILDEKPAPLN